MAKKVFNMQGGRHSAAALSSFINAMFGSSVANGLNVQVTGSAGLNVLVKAGNGNIDTGTGFGRLIQIDADETVALTAASASNPRNDIIVAYIDNTVTPTTAVTDNTNNILKFAAVAGTPASSPTDPSGSTIQAAVGAGNPYMILGRVRVNTSATSLTAPNITDLRNLTAVITQQIKDAAVTTPKLADNAVSGIKLLNGAVTPDKQTPLLLDWLDPGNAANVSVTSTSYVNITGVTTSINNPYNYDLKVMISLSFMYTASGGNYGISFGLSVNGVDAVSRYATAINAVWQSTSQMYLITIPANSSATLWGRAKTQPGGNVTWGRDINDSGYRTKIVAWAIGKA